MKKIKSQDSTLDRHDVGERRKPLDILLYVKLNLDVLHARHTAQMPRGSSLPYGILYSTVMWRTLPGGLTMYARQNQLMLHVRSSPQTKVRINFDRFPPSTTSDSTYFTNSVRLNKFHSCALMSEVRSRVFPYLSPVVLQL